MMMMMMRCRRQPTRVVFQLGGLDDGLTTPHHKTLIHYETRHTAPDLDKLFGTI